VDEEAEEKAMKAWQISRDDLNVAIFRGSFLLRNCRLDLNKEEEE
jgi:hypothetical protein